jgi:DNA polymerase III alpha subunit
VQAVADEIVRQRHLTARSGDEMVFDALEDHQGLIELVLFPRVWKEARGWFEVGKTVIA